MDICEALEKRGFIVVRAKTAEKAKTWVLSHVCENARVGIGGSWTVKQLGLAEALRGKGCKVLWHWEVPVSQMTSVRAEASTADTYLCSANAVTADGRIVNIDGYGNRIAATLFGPGEVVFLIGKNKLSGTLEEAMDRIHTVACPQNARRLQLKTPCAATGKCMDCASPDRMCGGIVILERAMHSHPTYVVWIDEELGF